MRGIVIAAVLVALCYVGAVVGNLAFNYADQISISWQVPALQLPDLTFLTPWFLAIGMLAIFGVAMLGIVKYADKHWIPGAPPSRYELFLRNAVDHVIKWLLG